MLVFRQSNQSVQLNQLQLIMNINFSKEEIELLAHASNRCCCESYYGYKCSKCIDAMKGFVTSRRDAYVLLKKANLVKFDYHGLSLTDSGKIIYKEYLNEKNIKTI